MLANSVIDLIGNTPLVKINNIDTFGNEIYIKLEGSNPGRSTKDRIALKMIEEAEKIAQSQVAWAILFILLFFIIIRYLIKTSDKREKKIMDLHEQSKADSNRREERLMTHLEKTTTELTTITHTVGDIQKEMVRMNDRMDEIEKGE